MQYAPNLIRFIVSVRLNAYRRLIVQINKKFKLPTYTTERSVAVVFAIALF